MTLGAVVHPRLASRQLRLLLRQQCLQAAHLESQISSLLLDHTVIQSTVEGSAASDAGVDCAHIVTIGIELPGISRPSIIGAGLLGPIVGVSTGELALPLALQLLDFVLWIFGGRVFV
ncbi:hypothetical protein M5D96_002657 [Drosophila gunungcola]|uniref:Uncharacterized protein n=1 Tax=Drosophila gunungcola TaxID=103775 RepID=A0A9P9Z156_9MUSC|nr:hypothetical protein M5D96_002657 [Drosophila gunungcola]